MKYFSVISIVFFHLAFLSNPCLSRNQEDSVQELEAETKTPITHMIDIESKLKIDGSKSNNDTSTDIILKSGTVNENNDKQIKKYIEDYKQHNQPNTSVNQISVDKFVIGHKYITGEGVPKDYSKAIKFIKMAADEKYYKAQFTLGEMYAKGLGVRQDFSEAASWFKKSAKQGDVYSQYSIALMYENGIGVDIDNEQALKWYAIADTLVGVNTEKKNKALIKSMSKSKVNRAISSAVDEVKNIYNIRDVSYEEAIPSARSFLENWYQDLEDGYAALFYTDKLSIDDTGKVLLVISSSKLGPDIYRKKINNEKSIFIEDIKICNQMNPILRGSAFNINLSEGKEIQGCRSNINPKWRWELNPEKEGVQTFYLSINVILSFRGIKNIFTPTGKSIEDTIHIEPLSLYKELINSLDVYRDGIIITVVGGLMVAFIRYLIKRYT